MVICTTVIGTEVISKTWFIGILYNRVGLKYYNHAISCINIIILLRCVFCTRKKIFINMYFTLLNSILFKLLKPQDLFSDNVVNNDKESFVTL